MQFRTRPAALLRGAVGVALALVALGAAAAGGVQQLRDFVADEEVHKVVDHLKKIGPPDYVEGILSAAEDDVDAALGGGGDGEDGESDALYDQAVEIVVKTRRPSISLVQRHLRIGYNRAARLIEQMERAGLVSPMGSNGNREVIVPAKESE